nr:FeoA family protein [Gramella sp. AN32]
MFKINLNKVKVTVANLRRGQRGIIKEFSADMVPLKLLEMGCLPGNEVELVQTAPFKDPMYLNINGSHLAIRKETALLIEIEIIK